LLAACSLPEDVGPRSTADAPGAAAARTACAFAAGTLPGLSLAADAPLGRQIPIDTFVLIVMENRSFDHMLGTLKAMQPDADVAPLDATNPDTDGTPIARFRMSDYCFDDPEHGWAAAHGEWDGGKMDGFVVYNYTNDGQPADGKRAMGYYSEADIPFFYGLANTFALADRSFGSLLGPTFPNRAFLQAGTSFGLVGGNLFAEPHTNLVELLEAGQVTWHDYYAKLPTLGTFIESLSRHLDNITKLDYLFTDAAAGNLAQVNFVDPELGDDFGAVRNDLHPPGDVQLGDQFLDKVIRALMQSPQWPRMAILVTFDEHGGLYDHVPPPAACPPDDLEPVLLPDEPPGRFDRLGMRVPTILISPYARPHHVSHTVYDHTSLLRLLEARFVLPAMTRRDANADPMFDLFDFDRPAFLEPPSLPPAILDPAKLADCDRRYPAP